MAKKRSKRGKSSNLGQAQTYEIHFFVPGPGFMVGYYSGESKEKALAAFKREYPRGNAFWIAPARGKALAGPQTMQYLVWWKSWGGPDWEPSAVFILDQAGNLLGSIPPMIPSILKDSWDLAMRRMDSKNPNHRFEFVDEATASLIANEIAVQTSRSQEKTLKDWEAGKFDQLDVEEGP